MFIDARKSEEKEFFFRVNKVSFSPDFNPVVNFRTSMYERDGNFLLKTIFDASD